jgi:hypothetical protein
MGGNSIFFLIGLGVTFDCLRSCKESSNVSSVAEKAVNLTDTEEVTIQYCIEGTLQSQLRQTLMLKKGLLLYRQEYEERTESNKGEFFGHWQKFETFLLLPT